MKQLVFGRADSGDGELQGDGPLIVSRFPQRPLIPRAAEEASMLRGGGPCLKAALHLYSLSQGSRGVRYNL